jgi:hypothetical protein
VLRAGASLTPESLDLGDPRLIVRGLHFVAGLAQALEVRAVVIGSSHPNGDAVIVHHESLARERDGFAADTALAIVEGMDALLAGEGHRPPLDGCDFLAGGRGDAGHSKTAAIKSHVPTNPSRTVPIRARKSPDKGER